MAPGTTSPDRPRRRVLRARDAILMAVLVVIWLGPLASTGGLKTEARFLPPFLRNLHRCACLFTESVGSWSTYHLEVQREGDPTWREFPEAGIFDMTVFGYRTKLHRVLSHAWGRPAERRITRALALYVRDRHATTTMEGPALVAVRFVRVAHPVDALAREAGAFRAPRLDEIPPIRRRITGETRFDGAPVTPPERPTPRRPRTAP